MSSSDWDEVKRLAADFQRAQLASSAQRLSEHNCVELINKLIKMKLLKVHYTTDGKEYVTPQQVQREMSDELYVAGGRINLVDLSRILGLDLSIIQDEAKTLLHQNKGLKLILGQIISKDYINSLVEEVNEKLLKDGTVSVDDLASDYQLPSEFLKSAIDSKLGKGIQAVQDSSSPNIYYTEKYLARLRARITGLMTAVTAPTHLHKITQHSFCNEKLFVGIIQSLISSGRVCGELIGNRQRKDCMYMPAIHSRAQNNFVDSFFRQNGYLEFDFLTRLGIEDPASYITRRFASTNKLLMLPRVCVGDTLMQQVDAAIEEALVTHSFVDISLIVPSNFSTEMTRHLITHCLENRKTGSEVKPSKGRKAQQNTVSTTSCTIIGDSCCVVSDVMMGTLRQHLETEMTSRGQKLVAAGGYKPKVLTSKVKPDESQAESHKKDERRKKAAGGKSGGGTQGRETKTRSTKGKKAGRRAAHHDDDESDEETEQTSDKKQGGSISGGLKFPDVEYLSVLELTAQLSKLPQLEDADEEMVEEIATDLYPWTKKVFNNVCEKFYGSLVSTGSSGKKKTFQQLQDKVLALHTSCKLAEKGTKEFDSDLEQQLSRHLLRSQCAELLSEMVLYSTEDSTKQEINPKDLTAEERLQIISQLPESTDGGEKEDKALFIAANKTISGTDLDTYFTAIEELITHIGILLPKKKDTKKDRQLLLSHRAGLLDQLSACHDPALCLHLAVLLLFHSVTGHILHASGKFVPHLVSHLKQNLPEDLNQLLVQYQGLVMKKLTAGEDSEEIGSINTQLEELTPQLQEKAITFKKSSSSNA